MMSAAAAAPIEFTSRAEKRDARSRRCWWSGMPGGASASGRDERTHVRYAARRRSNARVRHVVTSSIAAQVTTSRRRSIAARARWTCSPSSSTSASRWARDDARGTASTRSATRSTSCLAQVSPLRRRATDGFKSDRRADRRAHRPCRRAAKRARIARSLSVRHCAECIAAPRYHRHRQRERPRRRRDQARGRTARRARAAAERSRRITSELATCLAMFCHDS